MSNYGSPRSPLKRIPIHKRIYDLGLHAPGNVIRWNEAESLYRAWSNAAKANFVRGATQHHQNVSRILKRHFVRVEGASGYYVLKDSIVDGDA